MPGEPDGLRWVTDVTVGDVDELARQAADAGGEVVLAPMPLGDAGRITAVTQPHAGQLLAFEYGRPFQ